MAFELDSSAESYLCGGSEFERKQEVRRTDSENMMIQSSQIAQLWSVTDSNC